MKEALSIVRKAVLCGISKVICQNVTQNLAVLEPYDVELLCSACEVLCDRAGCGNQALACAAAQRALVVGKDENGFLKACQKAREACKKQEAKVGIA